MKSGPGYRCSPARGVHDVDEKHRGENPIIGHIRLVAGEELGDFLKPGRSGPANGRESTADENVPVAGPPLVDSSCFMSAVAKLRLDGTPTPRSRVARMTKRPASIVVGKSASRDGGRT
jgi:hypothetical protein